MDRSCTDEVDAHATALHADLGVSAGRMAATSTIAETYRGPLSTATIPHVGSADHQDMAIAHQWAARIPVPTDAIDDQTAIKVTVGNVEVVSERHWRLFTLIEIEDAERRVV
jgi:hypothetical protein